MIPKIEQHLAECLDLLQQQRAPLVAARDEAREALEQADRLLKQLDQSAACLRGEKRSVAKRKGKCSTKQEITALVEDILRQNEEVPVEDLQALVVDRLREQGRNLSMAGKLFKDSLKDERFAVLAPGIVCLSGR